ncbi:hypothetical protein C2845_PM15G24880 [Panicum miliaceum]|uniref:Uncharacterized protein n=1 Tax=Panicum miliaceum TaxID=4540 RepID=A0A3L6Q7H7_PANMI|nr:hypothetical protein C2845_PM15G24880 [Panicum miliaceum]
MLFGGDHVLLHLRYGFGSYFNLLPGSEWSALLLTYGFPLTIIGMALKARTLSLCTCTTLYAELKPVPCTTYADAFALREKCATPILKQVRSDVTRYRYGDEQHLDEALQRIFQYGLVSYKMSPINDRVVAFLDVMHLYYKIFEKKIHSGILNAKFTSFFGPGIKVEIGKGGDDLYEVRLISETA